jgi:hypothetical protein
LVLLSHVLLVVGFDCAGFLLVEDVIVRQVRIRARRRVGLERQPNGCRFGVTDGSREMGEDVGGLLLFQVRLVFARFIKRAGRNGRSNMSWRRRGLWELAGGCLVSRGKVNGHRAE